MTDMTQVEKRDCLFSFFLFVFKTLPITGPYSITILGCSQLNNNLAHAIIPLKPPEGRPPRPPKLYPLGPANDKKSVGRKISTLSSGQAERTNKVLLRVPVFQKIQK